MNFKQWLDLQERDNRGGARRIKNMARLISKPVAPAGPLRPDNVIPMPKPIKGTPVSQLNPFKKPKSTVLSINKK